MKVNIDSLLSNGIFNEAAYHLVTIFNEIAYVIESRYFSQVKRYLDDTTPCDAPSYLEDENNSRH